MYCGMSDILDFYKLILQKFEQVDVVGPMLLIDDIPHCYHMREAAINRHKSAFWDKLTIQMDFKSKFYDIVPTQIGTTFGMYRKDYEFKSPSNALRTHRPYAARHLGWYIDSDNLTEEQKYYINNSNDKTTHWGGKFMKEKLKI